MPRHVALFAIGLLLLAVPAFWPLYLSKGWAAVDRYTHAHAALGTLWMLFLIVQPALVLRHHRRAHRLAGRAALLVALGFVASGVLLTHYRVSRMTEAAFAKEGIYI
jgi:O-antigen/teichoic acid export membrane protein